MRRVLFHWADRRTGIAVRDRGRTERRLPAALLVSALLCLSPGGLAAADLGIEPPQVLDSCSDSSRTLAVEIRAVDDLQGYEAEIGLDETILALPDVVPYGFEAGALLGDSTFFWVQRLAEGSYRITHVKLGPPGVSGSGTLFTVTGDPVSETSVDMEVAVTGIDARNSVNQAIPVGIDPPAIVRVDCTTPSISAGEVVKSCFRGAAATDTIQVELSARDEGGTGARLDRIEAQIVEGTADCDPPGSWSLLVGGLSDTVYGPVIQDLPDPPHGGEWTAYLRAADAAGNRSDCSGYTFLYLPDPPPSVADLRAETLHRKIWLEWTLPAVLAGQEIRIVRKHWNSDGTSGYPQYLLDGTLDGGAYPADPSDGTTVHTTTDATSFVDEVGEITTEADIYLYRAFVLDCLDAYNGGSVPENISADFSAETLTDAVDAACNYWLGDLDDIIGAPYLQDGYVTSIDLSALSGSFGLTDGEEHFLPEADFGPSAMPTGSPTGVPRPDNQVDFEDVILLAINYGAVAPLENDPVQIGPSPATIGDPRLVLRTDRSADAEGRLLTAEIWLENHASGVRGVRAVLTYDPAALVRIGYEVAAGIRERPGATFHHLLDRPGACDVCAVTLGPGRGFAGSGPLLRVTFRVADRRRGSVDLEGVKLRDLVNRDVGSAGERLVEQDPHSPDGTTLTPRSALEVVPNPSRHVATIHLRLAAGGPVTMTIVGPEGRRLKTVTAGRLNAGDHLFLWDGTDASGRPVAPGVYFCDLRAGADHMQRKIILLQ